MRRNLKIIPILLISLVTISCNNKEVMMPKLKVVQTEKTGVITNLSLDLSAQLPQKTSSTRAIGLVDTKKDGKALINWQDGDSVKVELILTKEGESSMATGIVDGTIMKKSETNYQLKYKGSVDMSGIPITTSGNWYIQMMFFTGSDISQGTTINSIATTDLSKLNIPIGSEWKSVSVTENDGKMSLSANQLVFKPLGSILSFTVQNPLAQALTFNKVKVNTDMMDFKGSFSFTTTGKPSGLPNWQKSNNDDKTIDIDGLSFPEFVYTENASTDPATSDRVYLWFMPTKTGGSSLSLDLTPGKQAEKDGYVISTKPYTTTKSIVLEQGLTYTLPDGSIKIPESDLMISEVLQRSIHWTFKGGWYNYSMIELYNPTRKPIDLTQYGLVREYDIKSDSKYREEYSGRFSPNFSCSNIDVALKQDLYIPFKSSLTDGYYYEGPDVKTVDDRVANDWYHRYHAYVNRFRPYRDTKNYKNIIYPGKTIVLGAGGIMLAIKDADKAYYPPAFAGKYIDEAMTAGKCQYLITVSNGDNPQNTPDEGHSGVLQLGYNNVLVLVKGAKPIDVSGPFTYTKEYWVSKGNTDFNSTGGEYKVGKYLNLGSTNETWESYSKFVNRSNSWKGDDRGYDLIRKDYVYYPNYIWKSKTTGVTKEWIIVTGINSGKSVYSSLGTRTVDPTILDKPGVAQERIPSGDDAKVSTEYSGIK